MLFCAANHQDQSVVALQVGAETTRQPLQLGIGQGHVEMGERGPLGETPAAFLEQIHQRRIGAHLRLGWHRVGIRA